MREVKRVMNPFSIVFVPHARKYMGDLDIVAEAGINFGGVYFQKAVSAQ